MPPEDRTQIERIGQIWADFFQINPWNPPDPLNPRSILMAVVEIG
jgi:hypothetical protein